MRLIGKKVLVITTACFVFVAALSAVPQTGTAKTYEDVVSKFRSLTVGRTWKETVTLQGFCKLTKTVYVPSYTRIIIDGYISHVNRQTIFRIIDAVEVEIVGGVLENADKGVLIKNSRNIVLENLQIRRCKSYCVLVIDSQNVDVTGCVCEWFGDDGIAINGEHAANIRITGSTCSGGQATISSGSSGIEVGDGAHDVLIQANICFGNVQGINVNTHYGVAACHDIQILGNICYENNKKSFSSGIVFQGRDNKACNAVIADNICHHNRRGIVLYQAHTVKVAHNLCHSNHRVDLDIQFSENITVVDTP